MNHHPNRWKGGNCFNVNVYKPPVSPLAAMVIDDLIVRTFNDENGMRRRHQPTASHFNPGDCNNHTNDGVEFNCFYELNQLNSTLPKNYKKSKPSENNAPIGGSSYVEDLLNTNIDPINNIIEIPILEGSLTRKGAVPKTLNEDKFIPPTLEDILCGSIRKIHNEVPIKQLNEDAKKIFKRVPKIIPQDDAVDWNNMFDMESLFEIENTFNKRHSSNNVKGKTKRKPNAAKSPQTPVNVGAAKMEKPKSPFVMEVSNEPVPKLNLNQTKITDLVPKKKKKACDVNVNEKPKGNSFRKKSCEAAVKYWLENVNPEIQVEESLMDIDLPALSNNNNTISTKTCNDKEAVQTRLVNKDGVLKFTSTVHANKFIIHAKQSNIEEAAVIKYIDTINVKQIKPQQNESRNTTSGEGKEFIQGSSSSVPLRICSSIEQIKKKKSKFVAPIKSQVPVKDSYNTDNTFDVIKLSHDNFGEISNDIFHEDEIALTLTFKNGFSQLNQQYIEDDCVPNGIMIYLPASQKFYHLSKSILIQSDSTKKLIKNVMQTKGNKLCYDAKEIIIFVSKCLDLQPSEVANEIVDAKVACFLLDPDNPPQTFSEVQNSVSFTPEYTIATEDNFQKTAWYLTQLNECMTTIKKILNENTLWNIFVGIEMKLLPILAGLEMRGLQVDIVRLDSMKETIMEYMKQVEEECYKSAGKTFQINSPLQLRAILYDDLALDTKSNVKIKETHFSGAKSTSEAMLKSLTDVHTLPKLVLEYRHLHKALATFVTGMLQHVSDGIIRATWLQTAAVTGRIACNNPNLQAIPKIPFELTLYPKNDEEQKRLQLRSVYVARQGYTFLGADFQHVESRVFAHLAQDSGLLELFSRSGDFFTALASKWLNKRQESISREDRERTKRIVYASMYGAGTRKLMDILNTSYDQTLTVVSSFNATFPSLKMFGQRVIERCRQNDAVLETLCGRRRKFLNINSRDFKLKSQAERQAVNFVIQGSAADLCKLAMISTEKCLRELAPPVDCHLVLQIHDELVWEVAEQHLERVRESVKAAMEGCGVACGMNVPLPVAMCCGNTWAEMH